MSTNKTQQTPSPSTAKSTQLAGKNKKSCSTNLSDNTMKSDNIPYSADSANTDKAVSTDNTNGVVNTNGTNNSATNESINMSDNTDSRANTDITAARPQRIGIKQRKTDFTAYKETYFSPVLLNQENRHAINISKETWKMLERYSRILGDGLANVGSYADRIIGDHFAAYLDDLEAWRKL